MGLLKGSRASDLVTGIGLPLTMCSHLAPPVLQASFINLAIPVPLSSSFLSSSPSSFWLLYFLLLLGWSKTSISSSQSTHWAFSKLPPLQTAKIPSRKLRESREVFYLHRHYPSATYWTAQKPPFQLYSNHARRVEGPPLAIRNHISSPIPSRSPSLGSWTRYVWHIMEEE